MTFIDSAWGKRPFSVLLVILLILVRFGWAQWISRAWTRDRNSWNNLPSAHLPASCSDLCSAPSKAGLWGSYFPTTLSSFFSLGSVSGRQEEGNEHVKAEEVGEFLPCHPHVAAHLLCTSCILWLQPSQLIQVCACSVAWIMSSSLRHHGL